ncbi:MAG TPA: hypothetical protein VMN82_07140 [Thermoanaerobaculia bacterium]|nr:hypothetical protein [Thermoanaerobaculia bacterium]
MILGMSAGTFTALHVLISLIGIATGLVVLFGLLGNRWLPGWNAVFLWTTILTSVSGFGFPFSLDHLLPSHKVGILSLILLAVALVALYGKRLEGGWRRAYVYTAMIAEYLNVFVLVVQAFLKVPALHALAPNGKEPPFALAQGVVLVLFAWLIHRAAGRFRGAPASAR